MVCSVLGADDVPEVTGMLVVAGMVDGWVGGLEGWVGEMDSGVGEIDTLLGDGAEMTAGGER